MKPNHLFSTVKVSRDVCPRLFSHTSPLYHRGQNMTLECRQVKSYLVLVLELYVYYDYILWHYLVFCQIPFVAASPESWPMTTVSLH